MSTRYTVKSYEKTFLFTVTAMNDSSGNIRLLSFKLGGRKDNCITIGIDLQTSPTEAVISYVEYDANCVLIGNLQKGQGTVLMLRTALYCVYKYCPQIKTFVFSDCSNYSCMINGKLQKVNLAYDYIANHKQTWYEYQFKAFLKDSNKRKEYNDSLIIMDSKELKPLWENIKYSPKYDEKYSPFEIDYEESTTLLEFFNKLKQKLGNEYCSKVGYWTQYFLRDMANIKFFSDNWIIDVNSLVEPEGFSVIKTGGGDKRHQRKTRKLNRKLNRKINMIDLWIDGSNQYIGDDSV